MGGSRQGVRREAGSREQGAGRKAIGPHPNPLPEVEGTKGTALIPRWKIRNPNDEIRTREGTKGVAITILLENPKSETEGGQYLSRAASG